MSSDLPGADAKQEPTRRSLGQWLGVALRGMAMGVAELVPGVSGGTIAFITGIYAELLTSFERLPDAVLLLAKGRVQAAWQRANGQFLVTLVLGMATSVVLLASLLRHLLEQQPLLLWGFFFGLILASVPVVGHAVGRWTLSMGLLTGLGLAVGYGVTGASPLVLPETPVAVFVSGAVAICAWLLPGVSGSFLLLLLGMYQRLIVAITEGDLVFLLTMVAGMLTGLLLFARVMSWLLARARAGTLAVLTGFMAGSLHKLWPWQETLSYYFKEGADGGTAVPLLTKPVTPGQFLELSGVDPQVLLVVLTMAFGVVVVLGMDRLGRHSTAPSPSV